jgi:hypothetical protein
VVRRPRRQRIAVASAAAVVAASIPGLPPHGSGDRTLSGSALLATVNTVHSVDDEVSRRARTTRSAWPPAASPSPPAKPTSPAPTPAAPSPKPATPAAPPAPVAGLDRAQMDNAAVVVRVGKQLGLPRQAQVIAIATALQESNLYNVASNAVPESFRYPHQGASSDHDSVGLFQQRPSQGWGSVAQLMDPAHSAGLFYDRLVHVGGWQSMRLTEAAQAVQRSAFPSAYEKHEGRAQQIVGALR